MWGEKNSGDVRPMRTIVSNLRCKLSDDADNPTYIFTEPCVAYRMPEGETRHMSGEQRSAIYQATGGKAQPIGVGRLSCPILL